MSYPAHEHPHNYDRCPHKDGPNEMYERCVLSKGHDGNCLILGLPKPLALPTARDMKRVSMLRNLKLRAETTR
jgi:hypothetical protein